MLAAAPAFAQQEQALPDPAGVALPDLTAPTDAKVIKNGWKYFYFHKAGVSYGEAFADFADCYRHIRGLGGSNLLPLFAPWREVPGSAPVQSSNMYGLVGLGIGALVAGPIERRHYQARLRRCLEPRGYLRFPLPEKVWESLIDDYSDRSIAMQAKAASTPTPASQPVTK
jgi:hypothetical protein